MLSRIGECGPAAVAIWVPRVGGMCLDGLLPALNVEDIPMGLDGFKVLGGFKIDVGVASPPVSGRCDVRVGLVAGCCRCSNLMRLVI